MRLTITEWSVHLTHIFLKRRRSSPASAQALRTKWAIVYTPLKRVIWGIIEGSIVGIMKENIRGLDYGSDMAKTPYMGGTRKHT